MSEKVKEKSNFFKDWIMPIIVAIIISFFITKYLLFCSVISSGSMMPTLNKNDRVLVTRVYNTDTIKDGDIVVFSREDEENPVVKRVIGVGGDKISIKNGEVYRNGQLIDEPYVEYKDDYTGDFEVPKDKFFFLGDNRNNSKDSTVWDYPYIDKDDIIGKMQIKLYPFKDFGSVK